MNNGHYFPSLFRVNRREVELVHTVIFMEHVSLFCLRSADDPETAFFGFGQGVESSGRHTKRVHIINDLDGHARRAFAAMDDLRAECIFQAEVEMI